MSETINYEELVAAYEDGLLHRLRSHSVDQEFLEMWVPDEDVVASLLNMIEAAGAAQASAFSIQMAAETFPETLWNTLHDELRDMGKAQIEKTETGITVHVSDIAE